MRDEYWNGMGRLLDLRWKGRNLRNCNLDWVGRLGRSPHDMERAMTHTRHIDALPEDWNVGRAAKSLRADADVPRWAYAAAAIGIAVMFFLLGTVAGHVWSLTACIDPGMFGLPS